MTPQEIAEYKQRWMSTGNNNPVRIHSDLADRAKTWCRKNLQRHEWSMTTWTDIYEHTFFFEHAESAEQFKQQWPEYTDL